MDSSKSSSKSTRSLVDRDLLLTMQSLGIPLSADDRSTRVAVTRSDSRVSLAPLHSAHFKFMTSKPITTKEKITGLPKPEFGAMSFSNISGESSAADNTTTTTTTTSSAQQSTTASILAEASTRHVLPSAANLVYPLLSSSELGLSRQRNAKAFQSPYSAGAVFGSSFVGGTTASNSSSSGNNDDDNGEGKKKEKEDVAFLPSVSFEDAQESLTRLAPRAQKLFSVIECADKFAMLKALLESGQSSAADLISLAALDQLPPESSSTGGGDQEQQQNDHHEHDSRSKTDRAVQFLDASDDDDDESSDDDENDSDNKKPKPKGKNAPAGKREGTKGSGSRTSEAIRAAMRDFSNVTGGEGNASGGGGAVSSGMRNELDNDFFLETARGKEVEEQRRVERARDKQQAARVRRQRGE